MAPNVLCLWISVVRGIDIVKLRKQSFWWKGLERSVRSERHNRSKLLEVPRKSSEALLEQKKQAAVLLGLVAFKEKGSFQLCRRVCEVFGWSVCLETVRFVSEKPCAQCCWHPSLLLE